MSHLLAFLALLLAVAIPPAAGADISDAIERVDPAVVTVRAGSQGGAGFVVNDDGDIVTNAHVIGKAKKADVKLVDGRIEEGAVVATDERRDLALLRVRGELDHWVELGPSADLKLGEEVAAMGAPLGLEHSVTKGVISSRARRIGGNQFLQIDAALNPGNSGGPVINKRGAVIGVSTIMAKGAENVGFAIPSEVLVAFLDEHGVEYDVVSGDTIRAAAPAPETATEGSVPFGEETPPSIPLIVGVAAVVSVLCSAITSLLVLRVALHRAIQRLAARAPPAAAIPQMRPPQEDLSDIDITLESTEEDQSRGESERDGHGHDGQQGAEGGSPR